MQSEQLSPTLPGSPSLRATALVGVVETPLFPPDAAEPDFLVVRVLQGSQTRRPVVSTALVESVDTERRAVCVRGQTHTLVRLPERLPIAF